MGGKPTPEYLSMIEGEVQMAYYTGKIKGA
jgi:hypothetical protein